MTSFGHAMPFGAEPTGDGAVRFRLWAPGQRELALAIDGSDLAVAMTAGDGGWFETVTDRAGPGSAYQFVLPDGTRVPDPAARAQAGDVHGPSLVVDPGAYRWRDDGWAGRPWEETVVSELHVGTFTEDGTFDGVRRQIGRAHV